MSPCKCCRRACKRPLCRWPNLAQASECTGSTDKNPRRSRPPRRTQQCPHRCLLRDPHPLLHQEQSRKPQPRASPANTPPFSNLKSLTGIVHAPCFMFRNQICSCGPGGKSGSLPDADIWALSPKPVKDRGLVMFVGNQKSVWLQEVCFSSRIAQENTLSYVDFTECD